MIEVTVQAINSEKRSTYICEESYVRDNGKFIDLHNVKLETKTLDILSFNVNNIFSISQREIVEPRLGN